MKIAPEIKLVHALPGRVRLQSVRLKGNPTLMQEITGHLKAVPAFTQVEGNPITGSLLISFEPHRALTKQSIRQILGILKVVAPDLNSTQVSKLLKPGPAPSSSNAPLAASISHFFGSLNTKVGNTLGGIDLKVLLPTTLFFLGIRGLLSEKATPPAWYNLLWFALATFMMFHPARTPIMAETEVLNATVEQMADLGIGD